MNYKVILALIAPSLLAGLVKQEKTLHPSKTEDELVAACEGDIKHLLRKKIGFLVDVAWADSQFVTELDHMILTAVGLVGVEEKTGEPIK